MIIDGGNSFFGDTERRAKDLEAAGFLYIGTGVSGGEEGALRGPSIMPGGKPEAYALIEPIFKAIAAKAPDGDPCVTYIGPRGAGHYVKMVHNGIEYGDMQLIAEAYDILNRAAGLSAAELHAIFCRVEPGRALVLPHRDHRRHLRQDRPGDRQAAGGPHPGRGAAEGHRQVDQPERPGPGRAHPHHQRRRREPHHLGLQERARGGQPGALRPRRAVFTGDARDSSSEAVRDALYAAKICSYAQGMALLKAASDEYGYDLKLGEMARIWRGGCIIRAQFLNEITAAYERNPGLANLLLDPEFQQAVESRQAAPGASWCRRPWAWAFPAWP